MVWSDPAVQQLTNEFVSIADELHQLRTGETPEAMFFQKVFEQKHKHPGHQGVFLATPSGRLLASSTCYEADKVTALLKEGLDAWNELPRHDRLEPASELISEAIGGRPEDDYPADGLVLRVTARDLPSKDWGNSRSPRWHRYYLWFNRDEVRSILPEQPKVGQSRTMPAELSNRIVALALLDKGQVDGFTRPFRENDIQLASITWEITDVNESEITFQIRGQTRTQTRDAQAFVANLPRYDDIPEFRGVQTRMLGKATFDRSTERFSAFQVIAVGDRFGGAYVGRGPDDWDENPIGFSIQLGDGSEAERIAPEFPHRYPWLDR